MNNLLEGLGNNLLITVLSVILPLAVGTGLTVLMHFTKKTPVPKIFRILAVCTESAVPMLLVLVSYFCWFQNVRSALLAVTVAFSVSFLGYMVSRYEPSDSLLKNMTVNGIGLVADVFKWSTVVGYIGMMDMTKAADFLRMKDYETGYLLIPLAVIGGILLTLYLAKALCKNFMK